MPWRHVDQQVADVSRRHRLKVIADRIQVPVGHECGAIDDVPGLLDEFAKFSTTQLRFNLEELRMRAGIGLVQRECVFHG